MIVINNAKTIGACVCAAILSCTSDQACAKASEKILSKSNKEELTTFERGMLERSVLDANQGFKGTVVDKNTGEKLTGVLIVPDGNMKAAALTDANGNFNLRTSNAKTIRVSCVGYVTKNIAINDQENGVEKNGDNLIIALDEDYFKINEVVVTGQGAEISESGAYRPNAPRRFA